MIAHLVYFETLASINDETSPTWKSTVSGLVVLRLIDDWLDVGAHIVTTDVTGLRAIHDSISKISEGDPIRSILHGAVHALENAETASLRVIATHLMAYGRALHYAGQWSLAADVFQTLVHRAKVEEDSETLIQASLRLGFVTRRTGQHEESEAAYMQAEEEALLVGNPEGQARARLGLAQNSIDRGNLSKVEELIEEVVAIAHKHGLNPVLSDALHDRARLCHSQKRFSDAVRHAYSALEFTQDPMSRDRIMGDLAASFAELSHWKAAKDAHLIVLATAQEEWLRQQTLINLMDIAILEQQELVFHDYRRQLEDCNFQPLFESYFHMYSGKGFRMFGNTKRATEELQRSMEIATTHKFHQLEHIVMEELEKVSEPVHSDYRQTAKEWSPEVSTIASAIGHLRELTEAGTKTGTWL